MGKEDINRLRAERNAIEESSRVNRVAQLAALPDVRVHRADAKGLLIQTDGDLTQRIHESVKDIISGR